MPRDDESRAVPEDHQLFSPSFLRSEALPMWKRIARVTKIRLHRVADKKAEKDGFYYIYDFW